MAKRNWVMKQEWKNVVFLHWPVKEEWLRRFVPEELEIDLYDDQAWLGIVFFQAEATRLRFLPPVPGTHSYLELNVRTYVKYGNRQGVYFFSLDADSHLAVSVASSGGFLPYRHAVMSNSKKAGLYKFTSRKIESDQYREAFKMNYKPLLEPVASNKMEQWLTERYCLWTKPREQIYRVDIAHSPWSLQYLKGEIFRNTMASYLPLSLHRHLPIAHYSVGQKVRFFVPVKDS